MQCIVKKNFEIAEKSSITFITQVKDNQSKLKESIEFFCESEGKIENDIEHAEKGHGRLEKRIYQLFDARTLFNNDPDWGDIKE